MVLGAVGAVSLLLAMMGAGSGSSTPAGNDVTSHQSAPEAKKHVSTASATTTVAASTAPAPVKVHHHHDEAATPSWMSRVGPAVTVNEMEHSWMARDETLHAAPARSPSPTPATAKGPHQDHSHHHNHHDAAGPDVASPTWASSHVRDPAVHVLPTLSLIHI